MPSIEVSGREWKTLEKASITCTQGAVAVSKKPWVFVKGKLVAWQQLHTLWTARDPALMTAFGALERVRAAKPTVALTIAYGSSRS